MEGDWDTCEGTGGYGDFSAGMQLSIKGKDDEIVGTGSVVNITSENIIDVAKAELDGENPIGVEANTVDEAADEVRDFLVTGEGMLCALYFEAEIETSDYSIELGDRGDLSYARSELDKTGWVVSSSLGDL